MSILKLHPLSSTSIVGRLELLRILLTSFSHHKSIYFWEPNQIGGATRSADSFFQRQRQNYEAVSLARAGRLERCTKVAKGQEDDRNDKSQPNHSYVNLPQIKWDFLVYLIIFCVRSSSKRPLEESITWRKPRPKEIRSAGFMAFCWLGGRHRRYSRMVKRHLNSHVKDFSHPAMNAGSVPNDTSSV